MITSQSILDLHSCQTSRLKLRCPEMAHLDAVVAVHGDPATNRYNPDGPTTADGSRTMLSTWMAHWTEHSFGYWSVATLEQPDQIIGFGGVMLKQIGEVEALNLYFRFTPQAWGKGYATELGKAAIHMAFDLLGYSEVQAVVRKDNGPSRLTLDRLGMSRVGTIQDIPDREPSLLFSITSRLGGEAGSLSAPGLI